MNILLETNRRHWNWWGRFATSQNAFASWLPDAEHAQVSRNVAGETALAAADFLSLLTCFAQEIATGHAAENSWVTACRSHQLKGRQIPIHNCPAVLGRARTLDDHAKSVAKASVGGLTPQEAKKHLLKHSGSLNPLGFETFLRTAPLGNYLVWATFNADNSHTNPFDRLSQTLFGICTALGLGDSIFREALIVLVWNHTDSGAPPLHRPTVADAADYPYYRPCADSNALWGLTEPLPPNPDEIEPQPEVVMPEISSQGLRLPFRVVQA